MKKEINTENVNEILSSLGHLLTDDDKIKIGQETINFTGNLDVYQNIAEVGQENSDSKRIEMYFSRLESILIASKNKDKIQFQHDNIKATALCVAIVALAALLFVGAAALSVGGVVALSVVFGYFLLSALLPLSFVGVMVAVFLVGGCSDSLTNNGIRYEHEASELEDNINKSRQAYNRIRTFFDQASKSDYNSDDVYSTAPETPRV